MCENGADLGASGLEVRFEKQLGESGRRVAADVFADLVERAPERPALGPLRLGVDVERPAAHDVKRRWIPLGRNVGQRDDRIEDAFERPWATAGRASAGSRTSAGARRAASGTPRPSDSRAPPRAGPHGSGFPGWPRLRPSGARRRASWRLRCDPTGRPRQM